MPRSTQPRLVKAQALHMALCLMHLAKSHSCGSCSHNTHRRWSLLSSGSWHAALVHSGTALVGPFLPRWDRYMTLHALYICCFSQEHTMVIHHDQLTISWAIQKLGYTWGTCFQAAAETLKDMTAHQAWLHDSKACLCRLDTLSMLFSRETPLDPPQFYIQSWDQAGQPPRERQLSQYPHPYPTVRDHQKEILRYKRADGIDLTATLYLPPAYDQERDGPLPCILWAYPREFKSKVRGSGGVVPLGYSLSRAFG